MKFSIALLNVQKKCGIRGGKTSITNRLNGNIKSLYKKKFLFKYVDE